MIIKSWETCLQTKNLSAHVWPSLHFSLQHSQIISFLWQMSTYTLLSHHLIENHHDFTPLRLSFDLLLFFSLNLLLVRRRRHHHRRSSSQTQKETLTQFPARHFILLEGIKDNIIQIVTTLFLFLFCFERQTTKSIKIGQH